MLRRMESRTDWWMMHGKGYWTERSWSERDKHHRQIILSRWWGCLARCGDYCTAIGRSDCFLIHTDWKHPAFQVACKEREHCANVFRMGSGNSSFTMKSCACAAIPFLAGIISLSVESSLLSRHLSSSGSCSSRRRRRKRVLPLWTLITRNLSRHVSKRIKKRWQKLSPATRCLRPFSNRPTSVKHKPQVFPF